MGLAGIVPVVEELSLAWVGLLGGGPGLIPNKAEEDVCVGNARALRPLDILNCPGENKKPANNVEHRVLVEARSDEHVGE